MKFTSISILIAYTGFAATNLLHVIMASKDVSPHHIGHSDGEPKKPRMRHLCKNMQPAHVHALPLTPSPQTTKGKVSLNAFQPDDLLISIFAGSQQRLHAQTQAGTYPTALRPLLQMPFPSKLVEDSEEPSIEDLLAAKPTSSPRMDSSCGAQAWEELDIGVTVRRVDAAYDTVVPRRDGNGSGSGSSSTGSRGNDSGGSNNSSQRARHTVMDIFADPVDVDLSSALMADAGVQATEMEDRRAVEAEAETELKAKEHALEDEVCGTHAYLKSSNAGYGV
ncbi:hypothetical protein EI94DRAFT_1802163 [Lactarius quietus]|nr:hypothetical protein EI94DRAFT_1802163 [Lactarius quietus]